jgi:tRNA threonylcarbamoyladenosine modification (KEOPS) complex  Pcc1 subunit
MTVRKNNIFKISVNIEVEFSKNKEKDAIMKALLPDNINYPNNFNLEMSSNKNTLIINIESTNINTLINTMDEILHHISIATKVINHD